MVELSGIDEKLIEKGLIDVFYSQLKNATKESDFELVYTWDSNEFFGVRNNYSCVLKSLKAYLSEDFKINYIKFNSDLTNNDTLTK